MEIQDLKLLQKSVDNLDQVSLERSINGANDDLEEKTECSEAFTFHNDFVGLQQDTINKENQEIDQMGLECNSEWSSPSHPDISPVKIREYSTVDSKLIEINFTPNAEYISIQQFHQILDEMEVLFSQEKIPITLCHAVGSRKVQVRYDKKLILKEKFFDVQNSSSNLDLYQHQNNLITTEQARNSQLIKQLDDGIIFKSRYSDEPDLVIKPSSPGFSRSEMITIFEKNPTIDDLRELILIRMKELKQYDLLNCNYLI
ncbi:phosphoprotein [jopcycgri virus 1]|uniref:Phosphoprotein n=1 Tax=jopcycgri virus 1 TaxID=2992924 RepID=A0A9E7VB23_9RHAB|nr:phosphoprotein [jopcycgri virus 1]